MLVWLVHLAREVLLINGTSHAAPTVAANQTEMFQ